LVCCISRIRLICVRLCADSSGAITPLAAYTEFLANQYAAYWGHYTALPGSILDSLRPYRVVNGIAPQAPPLFVPLTEKRGNLYFFLDRYLELFLKISYDPTTKLLRDLRTTTDVPWADIALFVPLLKLEESAKNRAIEPQFESAAQNLSVLFEQNNFDSFIRYLVSHPANANSGAAVGFVNWTTVVSLL